MGCGWRPGPSPAVRGGFRRPPARAPSHVYRLTSPGFARPANEIGGRGDIFYREPERFEQCQLAGRPATRVLADDDLAQLGLHVVTRDRVLPHRNQQVTGLRERRLATVHEQARRHHGGGVDLAGGWNRGSDRVDVNALLEPLALEDRLRACGYRCHEIGFSNRRLGAWRGLDWEPEAPAQLRCQGGGVFRGATPDADATEGPDGGDRLDVGACLHAGATDRQLPSGWH